MASLYTELVSKEYLKRKSQNPRYSLRAFARDIGLNSGTLSSILKGKRKLPAHLFNDLSQKIESLSEHKDLYQNEFQRAQRSQNKSINFERLIDERIWEEIVTNGIFFSLLSLFNCPNFQSKPSWIADRLGVSEDKIKNALNILVRASLVKVNNGQYELQKETFSTRDEVASETLKKAHEEILDTAKEKIRTIDINDRDYTSVKFPCDPQKIALAKKEIRRFRKRMMTLVKNENANEVYELSIQLFPRTVLKKAEVK